MRSRGLTPINGGDQHRRANTSGLPGLSNEPVLLVTAYSSLQRPSIRQTFCMPYRRLVLGVTKYAFARRFGLRPARAAYILEDTRITESDAVACFRTPAEISTQQPDFSPTYYEKHDAW